MMTTLHNIELLTKTFAAARRELADCVGNLENEISSIKRRYMPAIKRRVEAAANAHAELQAALEVAPELFVKPRSIIIDGVKVGYQKAKGEITWDDPLRVVALIRRHLADQAETLIRVVETPVKTALSQLSVADLKKIGVTVIETGDQVLIKDTASDIDRLVEALLKEAIEEVEA